MRPLSTPLFVGPSCPPPKVRLLAHALCLGVLALWVGCDAAKTPDEALPPSDGNVAVETVEADPAVQADSDAAVTATARDAAGSATGDAATAMEPVDSAVARDATSGPASDPRAASSDAQQPPGPVADPMQEPQVPAADPHWPKLEKAQIGKPILIANGFSLAEGPLWDPCRQVLLFADVNPARLHQLVPPMSISPLHEMTNYTNGITFHPSGDLLRAEMGGNGVGRITRVDRAGNLVRVLADKNPSGQPLNTPDDLTVRSDGTIYFTDPTFAHGPNDTNSIFARPVYRITPESAGSKVVYEDSMASPNGVELTRDERTLYIASYLDENIYKYDVATDGALKNRRVFAGYIDDADSLCLDAAGNLYVGSSAGLRVYRPDASAVATIPMPSGDKVTNCEFGGSDGKTLYITAWKTLWRIEAMPIPGLQWEKHQKLPCAP